MKAFILLIGLCISLGLQGQENTYIDTYSSYYVNDVVYLFGNNVNLRSMPTTNSESLKFLPIGSKIIILEETEPNYQNHDPIWIKVRHQDTVGYIRSDFISLQTTSINGTPLYSQLKHLGDDGYLLRLRTPTQTEDAYIEKQFKIFASTLTLEVFGNRGLSNVDNILHLNYLAEACGVDGGGKYIFIKDNEWIDAFTYTQVADADIFYWGEELLFPDEHKQGDFILYKSEYMETIYKEDNYETPAETKTDTIEKKLYWDGKQILPKFKQEPNFEYY